MIARKCLLTQDHNPAGQTPNLAIPYLASGTQDGTIWTLNSLGQLCPSSSTAWSTSSLCLGQAPLLSLQIFSADTPRSWHLQHPGASTAVLGFTVRPLRWSFRASLRRIWLHHTVNGLGNFLELWHKPLWPLYSCIFLIFKTSTK